MSPEEPWFRLGRLEVTSSALVALIAVATALVWVISPTIINALVFWPQDVAAGELWRVITWPLANTIYSLLTALILWWFGRDLERLIGRVRMLWLFVGIWASLTAAAFLLALVPGFPSGALAGIGLIETAVLLLWIAEYPNRPFFFGIPAWVFGAVILAMNLLGMLADRDFGGLGSLLVAISLTAIMGKRFGLLSAYDWIPGRPAAVPTSSAPARTVHRPRPKPDRQAEQRLSDRERLDELLDQINERGIDSLTPGQRREMMRLRDRIRRP